jgi:hypothetical protein
MPRQPSGSPQVIEDPVPDGSDQRGRHLAICLAGSGYRRARATRQHLDQYGGLVLSGKGILWQILEQQHKGATKGERRAQQLFDQGLCRIRAFCSPAYVTHPLLRNGGVGFAPVTPTFELNPILGVRK